MAEQKNIEQRIREHYCVAGGEWLIEKGKVKEAKLLKEAVERIEQIARHYGAHIQETAGQRKRVNDLYAENRSLQSEIAALKKQLEKTDEITRLAEEIASIVKPTRRW